MQFDLVTIFPEYFAPLSLSLMGKAQSAGAVSVNVHNLRDWASGKHLSVDDSPIGGGAGMVMKADVWGRALDQVFSELLSSSESGERVLAIPSPSGVPLTQRTLERLAGADQIVVACGRYEGIDSRVAEHYRADEHVEVLEFSLGDYVLNGGEVAALALVEGVSRLVEGVVGNPDSLVEESHGEAGLLEYPVFTGPRTWRGEPIPNVLLSGDHGKIARWRRDQSLRRTARIRPDMIEDLAARPGALEGRDREVLAGEGILVRPVRAQVTFRSVGDDPADLEAVGALAARTFPLACPPGVPGEEVDQFVAANLTPNALSQALQGAGRICVAEVAGTPIAYTLMFEEPSPEALGTANAARPTSYLSKCYTDLEWQGSGVSGALLDYAIKDAATQWDFAAVALATNRANKRAAKFYRRHGFVKAGTRLFDVGGRKHADDVFVRDLTSNPLL